jgi:subtilisin family serine protease
VDGKPKIFLVVLLILGVLLVVAAGIIFLLKPQDSKPPKFDLPPSLDELADQYPELSRLLSDPKLDAVYKEFLVVYEDKGEEAAMEMARERGLVISRNNQEYVRLTLVLDTEDSDSLIGQLEDLGINIISAFRDQIEVAIPVDLVKQELASDEPGAIFEKLTEMEHVVAVQLPERAMPDGSIIEGEGVGVIDADAWQDAGVTGAGLRVGVLDMGFMGYEDLLGEELPDEVLFREFGWSEDVPREMGVHGTACAEVIHEIAPDAELVLAQYDGSPATFGEAVEWLVNQDVDIISHSAGGVFGPRDGSGPMASLVDEVTSLGILWVNSAGNEALSHHRGQFTDADGDGIHEFPSGDEALAAAGYGTIQIVVMWDDWDQVTQDFDVYVYDQGGDLLGRSEWSQSGQVGESPAEAVQVASDGEVVFFTIVAQDADQAVTFDVFVRGGQVDYPSASYSVCAPADAYTSLSVGAANWSDDVLEDYSSQGPTTDERLKPEISAPTNVDGASYGEMDMVFNGTSAACPHVAGAAALVWQAHPEYSAQEVGSFLVQNSIDRGPSGPDTGYGYGRLQLPQAPDVVVSPEPVVTDTPGPTAEPGSTETPVPESPTLQPIPTSTPVTTYEIPTQIPTEGPIIDDYGGGGFALLAGVGLLVLGLGCGGAALLLIGVVGLIFIARRGRRRRQGPPAPQVARPAPQAPPSSAGAQQMIQCPHCNAAVRPGARFCAACGGAIDEARQCPHCGAPLREGVKFCSRCGESV